MCQSCKVHIDGVWSNLKSGFEFKTPDDSRGKPFKIDYKDDDKIRIKLQGIYITRLAFVEALHYLRTNKHYKENKCVIGSSNDPNSAGPLCQITRMKNYKTKRCINYILPILEKFNIVRIDGTIPNQTGLIC